jgi:hypothetical protein
MQVATVLPCSLELLQLYFSVNKQYFSLTTNQHKPNFSETNGVSSPLVVFLVSAPPSTVPSAIGFACVACTVGLLLDSNGYMQPFGFCLPNRKDVGKCKVGVVDALCTDHSPAMHQRKL